MKNSKPKFNRIAIKDGSNVITQSDGSLNDGRISGLVEDTAILYKQDIEVVLISSGAVVGHSSDSNVLIYADEKAYLALDGKYPSHILQIATNDSFGTEFLSYKMAIKTVK